MPDTTFALSRKVWRTRAYGDFFSYMLLAEGSVDIVGEHDILFASAGERIILRHVATDRAIFARGALKAAIWGQGKKPGHYDMMDVLGL